MKAKYILVICISLSFSEALLPESFRGRFSPNKALFKNIICREIKLEMNPNVFNFKYLQPKIAPILLFLCGTIFATIFNPFIAFRVLDTSSDVPLAYIKEHKVLSGVVKKVIDGDTYRIRHTPMFFSGSDFRGLLSEKTIVVRISAVDTPETSKFGKEGQPYGKEATDFVVSKILNRKVSFKLFSKDQYNRVVASVKYKENIFFEKDISEELLKKGLAVVYRQSGAQYGDNTIDVWNEMERKAKKSKIGIWGAKGGFETPSEYKKRNK